MPVERVEKLALAQVPDLERTVEAAGEDVVSGLVEGDVANGVGVGGVVLEKGVGPKGVGPKTEGPTASWFCRRIRQRRTFRRGGTLKATELIPAAWSA